MIAVPMPQTEVEAAVRSLLEELRVKYGGEVLAITYVRMGKATSDRVVLDEAELDLRMDTFALGDVMDALLEHDVRERGAPWFVARLQTDGDTSRIDRTDDEPPPAAMTWARLPGAYVEDLELFPRPPALVPGWMKIELAAVGAWDLKADELRWSADREPTGVPQTPASVGVEPPPGAEYALRRR